MSGRQQALNQGTWEWKQFRKGTVGSSDAPAIMGVSPWSNPVKLWEEKIGIRDEPHMTERMLRGHDLEEEARYHFEKEMGITVMPATYLHEKHDWMSASLDGISFDEKIAVEIKCPGMADHNAALQGKIPEKYYPQLQHQMAVAGVGNMFYMSYEDPTSHSILKVERDDAYVNRMMALEKTFWDCVQTLTRPFDGYVDKAEEWEINDEAVKYLGLCECIEKMEAEKDQCRKKLIEYAASSNYKCKVLKVTKICSKGRVKYDSIPELENIDIERYRGKPTETWRIEKI